MNQGDLLRDLLQELDQVPDHEVCEIITGTYGHLGAVESAGMGIASWALHRPVPLEDLPFKELRGVRYVVWENPTRD